MKVIQLLAKVNAIVSNLSDIIGLHSKGRHCGEEGDLELSVDELAGLPVEHRGDLSRDGLLLLVLVFDGGHHVDEHVRLGHLERDQLLTTSAMAVEHN